MVDALPNFEGVEVGGGRSRGGGEDGGCFITTNCCGWELLCGTRRHSKSFSLIATGNVKISLSW